MNSTQLTQAHDRFGRQVAARLAAGANEVPYDVTERLRAARVQALTRRKRVAGLRGAAVVSASGASATLTGDERFSLFGRIASALPLIALVGGLVLIHTVQQEHRATEVAEVDAALLTDDLPPAAYADPGFLQFVKQSGQE